MSDVKAELVALVRAFRRADETDRPVAAAAIRALLDGDRRDEARHFFPTVLGAERLPVQWALRDALGLERKSKTSPTAKSSRRDPTRSPGAVDTGAVEAAAEVVFPEVLYPRSRFAARGPATDVRYLAEPLRKNSRISVFFTVGGESHTISAIASSHWCDGEGDQRACEEHLEEMLGQSLDALEVEVFGEPNEELPP